MPALAGVLAFTLLMSAVRRLALPLGDLIEAAQRVEAGDLEPRVRLRGSRDLRALGRAFNSMLDRLQQNEVQRRQLLADVTHELRTPVAVLQGNLEAMVDGVYPADAEHLGPLVEETRLLSRLIDDLRTLSLAESGVLVLHREPTDLDVLIGEVVAAFRAQAEGGGVRLVADVPDDAPLAEIDPLRVREVLFNLTANALRHTPPGGEVRIAVAADSGMLRFSVVDTGSGIAAEDLPHVFERFYKTAEFDRQRAGAGDRPQPGAGARRRDRGRERRRARDDDPVHAAPRTKRRSVNSGVAHPPALVLTSANRSRARYFPSFLRLFRRSSCALRSSSE